MREDNEPRFRVLFLCTQNSARSQIAEALLNARGEPRVLAGSAGTEPAPRVNPYALELLKARGIDATAARPKDVDDVLQVPWDLVITVCDSARESCPVLPGRAVTAHWGLPDPAAVQGDEEIKRRAFQDTAAELEKRLDLLLALPLDRLDSEALKQRVREIGLTTSGSRSSGT